MKDDSNGACNNGEHGETLRNSANSECAGSSGMSEPLDFQASKALRGTTLLRIRYSQYLECAHRSV